MNKKNLLLSVSALFALGLTLISCKDEENPQIVGQATRLTARIDGASEKPTSTTSAATGDFTGILNENTGIMSYTVTYQGLSAAPTGGHLHRITQPDLTGPVDIPFTSLTSPIIGTTPQLRAGQIDSLKQGFYYVNIHTPTYPAGEIRGDIRLRSR